MRALLSSTEIGRAFAVMDFNSAPDAAAKPCRAAIAMRGAAAAARSKTRLDSMVILFNRRECQGYCNSGQRRLRDGNMPQNTMGDCNAGNVQTLRAAWVRLFRGAGGTRGIRRRVRANLGG